MKLLLDTHVLLWWLEDNPSLNGKAREYITQSDNLVFVSAAVIWEIQIKKALGKLRIPTDFRRVVDRQSFEMLAITAEHAYAVGKLPVHHRDPFDRILIAQAIVEGFTIVSHDEIFGKYGVALIKT